MSLTKVVNATVQDRFVHSTKALWPNIEVYERMHGGQRHLSRSLARLRGARESPSAARRSRSACAPSGGGGMPGGPIPGTFFACLAFATRDSPPLPPPSRIGFLHKQAPRNDTIRIRWTPPSAGVLTARSQLGTQIVCTGGVRHKNMNSHRAQICTRTAKDGTQQKATTYSSGRLRGGGYRGATLGQSIHVRNTGQHAHAQNTSRRLVTVHAILLKRAARTSPAQCGPAPHQLRCAALTLQCVLLFQGMPCTLPSCLPRVDTQ